MYIMALLKSLFLIFSSIDEDYTLFIYNQQLIINQKAILNAKLLRMTILHHWAKAGK
jgi:hypothetical protein